MRKYWRADRRSARLSYVFGEPLGAPGLKEIAEVRTRMELELGRETPGRVNVKLGRGGLVDVEFLTQALQLVHGRAHPEVRRPGTVAALRALGRVGALAPGVVQSLVDHHRFLRRVSAGLRLLSARPPDALKLAGPMPARVAAAIGYPSRDAFLKDYRAAHRGRAGAVRGGHDPRRRRVGPGFPISEAKRKIRPLRNGGCDDAGAKP